MHISYYICVILLITALCWGIWGMRGEGGWLQFLISTLYSGGGEQETINLISIIQFSMQDYSQEREGERERQRELNFGLYGITVQWAHICGIIHNIRKGVQ